MKRTPYRVLVPIEEMGVDFGNELFENMEVVNDYQIASYLTEEEYKNQLMRPDDFWVCPRTGIRALFDDEWYEEYYIKGNKI
jgi:hypothetical protein